MSRFITETFKVGLLFLFKRW